MAGTEQFLKYDGWNGEERVLIFSSNKCLDFLEQVPKWGCDGTFEVVPLLFDQLWILYVLRELLEKKRDVDTLSGAEKSVLPSKRQKIDEEDIVCSSHFSQKRGRNTVVMKTEPNSFIAIEKDGNCFYRSISLLMYDTQNSWVLVRSELMQFLLLNQNMPWARFFQDIEGDAVTVDEYVEHYKKPSVWGSSQQLLLAAELYSVNFVLYQPAITPRYVNFSMDLAEEEPKKITQSGGGTRLAYQCTDAPLNPMVETFMIRYQDKLKHFDVVETNFDDC
uniref:OTU domain-containing protein n=1 Tax=Ditylenchus dipsaci TaxID=166011 RepID=A0A915EBM5_9BILA